MIFEGPVLLEAGHRVDDFDCGQDDLNAWLRGRALSNQRGGGSRTWVVLAGQRVVAFYASSTAVLVRSGAASRVARNQPDPLPAILLGRLAVDARYRCQGVAAALVKHFMMKSLEVAEITGVRLLLVHAKDAAARSFYRHYGFEPSPVDELTLMLLLTDLRLALTSPPGENPKGRVSPR